MLRFLFDQPSSIDGEDQGIAENRINHLDMLPTELQIGQQCAICLENIQADSRIINLSCNHYFHKNCILRWYREHSTCPMCRTQENYSREHRTEERTIRVPLNSLILMSSSISIKFVYPNNDMQITYWSTHTTIIELFQFISKSINLNINMHINIQIRNENHVFKTTESFNHLNKSLLTLNISPPRTEFIISFI
jgi:hypothetical protein